MFEVTKSNYERLIAAVDAASLDDAPASTDLLAETNSALVALQAVCPHLLLRREGRASRLGIAWRCDCCDVRSVPAGTLVTANGEGNTVFTVARVEDDAAWLETAEYSIGWKNIDSLTNVAH